MIWMILAACAPDGGRQRPEREALARSVTEQLARVSIDLRGVRPAPEELARVRRDPEALSALIDEFLYDPRFEERVRASYAEALLTRMEDLFFLDYAAVETLLGEDYERFVMDAGEEPLRVMSHIAMSDLPYETAVTGDFTFVNERLGAWFPTDRDPQAEGWALAHYTDGRPAAGILASTGLWWRFPSTPSNKQRKRANVVSKIFVCRDFLQSQVPFDNDVNLLDEEALDNAIRTNPGCKSCHDDLEPIASYFWGFDFYFEDGFLLTEGLRYHAERERTWEDETGIAPGWYGARGSSLADLGRQLVRDPDFDPCAARHVYQHLLRRPWVAGEDDEALAEHVRAFRQGGRTVRSIWRSVLDDPRYRGVEQDGVTSMPRKVLTPDLLRSTVRDLTGFDWTIDGYPQLEHESYGLVTLAGGIDGATVTTPAHQPNTTMLLVQDRLATGAAAFAVQRERRMEPEERRLFRKIYFEEEPGDRIIRRQLAELYLLVLGREVEPKGPEVAALERLWEEVYALEPQPATAWKAVLAALLRDPEFILY